MKLRLLTLLIISIASTQSANPRLRALWNLEEVTECELHYNALHYNNYGCWCGIGGSHEPVDGIDECCMHHDKCYDAAVDNKVCMDVEIEYVDDYAWQCLNSTAICSEKNAGCKAALCECDKIVVECWKKYPKPEKKAKCNRTLWAPITKHFQH
ncbi:hypothetical protein CAEBREN_28685 [Caenorhabditis brenneri]|uniref:Phospholipase A2 n=1 Tax=Caenorhabditis brenneri TaxID=135651 RepID=G0NR47_CAEBE|nr:hypothetical protein CAEBREN_28685 [Caenorhabditis brenneri]